MKKRVALWAIVGCLIAAFRLDVQAQKEPQPSEEELMAVFMMRFDIAPPDTTFTEMDSGEGWEEKSTLARIVCTALPASFGRVMQDAHELSNMEGGTLLSKDSVEIGGVQGFLAKMEFSPPQEEETQEPFIALMFMRPWGQNITLNINAAYPKSQDGRLYPLMLASFATVRKKE